jgi:proton-dependent oligopeptide transporter, POT family
MLRDHPRGLLVLFFTEMWERFGFYVMMAILTLYMGKEFGWDEKMSGKVYGIFLGVVYIIPILGGFLGDRVLGQRHTIRIGAVLMAIGFVALTVSSRDRIPVFYAGLALVAVGTGLFKANISVVVSNLVCSRPTYRSWSATSMRKAAISRMRPSTSSTWA